MHFSQRWEGDDYVDVEALGLAIAATCEALGLSVSVMLDDDAPDDFSKDYTIHLEPAESAEGSEEAEHDDDMVVVRVLWPVVIVGAFGFSGFGLSFSSWLFESAWEPAFLFVRHLATVLGMQPEPRDAWDSEFIDDVRACVNACVEDACIEAGVDPFAVNIETTAGALGPIHLATRCEHHELIVDIRGVGTDVCAMVVGAAEQLSTEQTAALADDTRLALVPIVADEWPAALGRSTPAARPQHARSVMLHIWADGECVNHEVLDEDASVEAAVQRGSERGTCEIVRYISGGAPVARWVGADVPNASTSASDLLEYSATWIWQPTAAEVEAAFAASVQAHPASAPAAERSLREWLRGFAWYSGKLVGVPAERVRRDLAWMGEELLDEENSTEILSAIERLSIGHDDWEEHRSWIIAGQWSDDSTDMFVDNLCAMLGLPEPPEWGDDPGGRSDSPHPVAVLNDAAAKRGAAERLYTLQTFDVQMLLVKLHPTAFASLTAAGLLQAQEPTLSSN